MTALAWVVGGVGVAGCWLLGWAMCRVAARADADEAQRELLALLAEQADDRDIADNLDV